MTTATNGIIERFVDTGTGVRIATYEQGAPDGPPLILVHGWPDSHVLWDGVVPLLGDRFRIIRYDNRGVGKSSAPKAHSEYSMARFADDFAAVTGQLCPGEKVHVLAHDWGSIGVWEYLSRPGAGEHVASFTSVSGPSADHTMIYLRRCLARPYRPTSFLRGISGFLRLSYMALFTVPVLPAVAVRTFGANLIRRFVAIRDGVPEHQLHYSETFPADAARSIKVYRANAFDSIAHPRRDHYVDVPVQLIVNTRDPFIRPYAFDDAHIWTPRLWRRDIRAGHWAPMSHPQVLARSVVEFVDVVEGEPPTRALLRAQVGRRRDHFGDTLVSVTGAGSGIGRDTALAFACEGAELVVSDIDEAAAEDTAARITARGGVAHAYRLDVADAEAVDRFAERVCAAHGLPDIVVNNAGVGQAGAFLDTPAEQWDRVLDINLGGVVNGCRAFAGRLVERGTGGHIVNVASMAAYSPMQSLNAYCTSKAAVYMFSDCLRAELAAAGVGLTTICPGVVNTNIVHTTRFDAPAGKGEQVGGRRQQLERFYAARKYGPDKVAKAIVAAVKSGKAIRPVTPEAYLAYGTSRLAPQVLRSTARSKIL